MAMWLGTMSSTWPRRHSPSRSRLKRTCASSPPSSSLTVMMIDYVIAVPAAGSRLQIWRAVNVTDAEIVRILCDRRGIVEREILMRWIDRWRAGLVAFVKSGSPIR